MTIWVSTLDMSGRQARGARMVRSETRLGTIVISTAGGKTEIKNVDKNDGNDVVHIVRARLGAPSPTRAVPAGVASLEQQASILAAM